VIITTSISVGELIDKLTILDIKINKIADVNKLTNVKIEFDILEKTLKDLIKSLSNDVNTELVELMVKLRDINGLIWEVEDNIRDHERRKDFGNSFVQLARNVYQFNDRRASIKRQINNLLGSTIIEEKSYNQY